MTDKQLMVDKSTHDILTIKIKITNNTNPLSARRVVGRESKNSTYVSASVQRDLVSTYQPNTITEMHASTGIVTTYLTDLLLTTSKQSILNVCEIVEEELLANIAAVSLRFDAHGIEHTVYNGKITSKRLVVNYFNDNRNAPRDSDVTLWDPMWSDDLTDYVTCSIFQEFTSYGHLIKAPHWIKFDRNKHVYPIYSHKADGDTLLVLNSSGIIGTFCKHSKAYYIERKVVLADPLSNKNTKFQFAGKSCKRKPNEAEPRVLLPGSMKIKHLTNGSFFPYSDLPTKEKFKTTHIYRSRYSFINSIMKFESYPGWKESKTYIKFLGYSYDKEVIPKACAHPHMAWLADLSPFVFISKLPVNIVNVLLIYPGKRDVGAAKQFNLLCDKHNQEHLKICLTQWQPDRASRDITTEFTEEPKGDFDMVWFNEVYHGIDLEDSINLERAFSHSKQVYITGFRCQTSFAGVIAGQVYIKQEDKIVSYVGSSEDYVTPIPTPLCYPGTHIFLDKRITTSRQLATDIFPNYFNVKMVLQDNVRNSQKESDFVELHGVKEFSDGNRLYLIDVECLNKYELRTKKKYWTEVYSRHLSKLILKTMLDGPSEKLYNMSVRIDVDGYLSCDVTHPTIANRVANDTVEWLLIGSKTKESVKEFNDTCARAANTVNKLSEIMKDPWCETTTNYIVSPECAMCVITLVGLIFCFASLFNLHILLLLPIICIIMKIHIVRNGRLLRRRAERNTKIQVFDWTLVW